MDGYPLRYDCRTHVPIFMILVYSSLLYIQVCVWLFRQQEAESMSVQFLCQSSEDKEWYFHWQKYRLRWWKRVSSFISLSPSLLIYLCCYLFCLVYQLAANPENFSLVETPTSELPEYTLQESFIKVCYSRHAYICPFETFLPSLIFPGGLQ